MRVSTGFLEERRPTPTISGEFEIGTVHQGPTGVVRLLESTMRARGELAGQRGEAVRRWQRRRGGKAGSWWELGAGSHGAPPRVGDLQAGSDRGRVGERCFRGAGASSMAAREKLQVVSGPRTRRLVPRTSPTLALLKCDLVPCLGRFMQVQARAQHLRGPQRPRSLS